MRQTGLVAREKHLLALLPSDSDDDDGEEPASPLRAANPFRGLANEESSSSGHDEEEEEAPTVELVVPPEPRSAPSVRTVTPSVPRASTPSGLPPVLNIFALQAKFFDWEREVRGGGGGVGSRPALKHGSATMSSNLWLLPTSPLMKDIHKARSGHRWVGYDPESELYFRLIKVPEVELYNWEPTDRYLSTWSSLEAFISTGRIDEVHSFLQMHPYHPAANLSVAEYHVGQDQFDTAHQFFEKALSAFQYGLAPSLQPAKMKRPRLGDLDLRRMAETLTVLQNDLVVDWAHSEESAAPSRRERDAQVRAALSVHENGNLMFCRVLHQYATSLAQRGLVRSALEYFRLLNVLTLGNDVAHSLLVVGEAAARSGSTRVFEEYNQLYFEQTRDIAFMTESSSGAAAPDRSKLITKPWLDRLESVFPSFCFGAVELMIRTSSLRVRTLTAEQVLEVLDGVSAPEFAEYVDQLRAESDESNLGSSLKACCLRLVWAIYLYNEFPRILSESAADTASLTAYDLFIRKQNPSACSHEYPCAALSSALLSAYAQQSREFWQPLLKILVIPCAVRAGQYYALVHERVGEPADLVHEGLAEHYSFLDQYRGVRPSEFSSKCPILPDALLNSSTEAINTSARYLQRRSREDTRFANTTIGQWLSRFVDSTRALDSRSGVFMSFLQTLMPWTRLSD